MASFHYLPWYGKENHVTYHRSTRHFRSVLEARQKGFLTVMDCKERGIPLVGTYCTFMPQEIPMAAGAVVVFVRSTSDETIVRSGERFAANLAR
ncbi:hypothetical protein ACVXHA_02830 [Escherichia coli]